MKELIKVLEVPFYLLVIALYAFNNGDNSVAIGAHTSFPDLIGFGRRNMAVSHAEARDYVVYQIGALAGFVKSNNSIQ